MRVIQVCLGLLLVTHGFGFKVQSNILGKEDETIINCTVGVSKIYFKSDGILLFSASLIRKQVYGILTAAGKMTEEIFQLSPPFKKCKKNVDEVNALAFHFTPGVLKKNQSLCRPQDNQCSVYRTFFSEKLGSFENNMLQKLHNENRWQILIPPNRHTEFPFKFLNYKSYIKILKSQDLPHLLLELYLYVNFIKSYSLINYSGRFIVVLIYPKHSDNTVYELMKFLRNKFIFNVMIVVKDISETVRVFAWLPYIPPSGQCGNIISTVLFSRCYPNKEQEFFYDSALFDVSHEHFLNQQCNLSMKFNKDMSVTAESRDGKYSSSYFENHDGVYLRLMEHIAQYMNTSLKFDSVTEEADVINAEYSSGHVLRFYDMIYFFSFNYRWYVPRAKLYPSWYSIFRVFDTYTWLCLLLTLVFVSLSRKMLGSLSLNSYTATHGNITEYLLGMWGLMIGLGVPQIPKDMPLRLLYLFWTVYSMSMETVFNTFVISYFFNPGYQHQINSFEEILGAGHDIITDVVSTFIKFSDIKNITVYNVFETFDALVLFDTKSDVSYFANDEKYKISIDEQCHSEFSGSLHRMQNDYDQSLLVMLLFNPFTSNIIKNITCRLVEGGFPVRIARDVIGDKNVYYKTWRLSDLENEYAAISLEHIQSPLILFTIGVMLSFILFIGELSTHKVRITTRNSGASE